MNQTKTGFTLIEVLVAMSIIALLLVCAFSAGADMLWVSHESQYHNALRLLKQNDTIISEAPTDNLPPEIRTIPASGIVNLSNTCIMPGSLTVISQDNTEILPAEYSVDYDRGIISFHPGKLTKKQIVVKYTFMMPDRGELCRIPSKPPYRVVSVNSPIKKVIRVETLSGGTGTEISESMYHLEKDRSLTFDPSLAGKCIRITSIGGIIRSQCTGKFLTPETLSESASPTNVKLIKIREIYGAGSNYLETVNMRFMEVKNAK